MGNQTLEMNQKATTTNEHDIGLSADRSGDIVIISLISGDPGPSLGHGSGAHRFRFTLQDSTGINVQFASLDTQDNWSSCPPPGGDNSGQISGVQMHNNPPLPRNAAFTDNNSNPSSSGPMDVCYQWNFTCDDQNVTVRPYDPIIRNGGTP
jgi:hypothetical protein